MSDFEKTIGYTFKDKSLLKLALTHSSAGGKNCNERMEFLGDSILSAVTSEYLYRTLQDKPEGHLTKIRASLVCEDALYKNAKKIGLGEWLVIGKGEESTGGRDRKSILSDAFEAVIAAIYLDSGLEAARGFILPFLPDKKELRSGVLPSDYKTALQEIVQQNPDCSIVYELTGEEGSAHERVFFTNVIVNGKVKGSGSGRSKKESQQQAAKAAIITINNE